jgi:CheY-like chemotaxis protein
VRFVVSLKILLADDSMTAQNMGKKILVDAGYDVVAVSNGAAAIKKIASDRPDIIILDVYMPGYTGLEVCERVKGASETSRTPVLLTVGKMEPFKPEEANRVRADGVMIKPFEATDLIAVIEGIANKMTAAPARQEATVRVLTPKSTPSQPTYEETVRLTPEQIRAFQDKSYKDWVASAQVEAEEKPVTDAVPEMAVSGIVAEDTEPITQPSILEPMESVVIAAEPETATPIMPGLDPSESHMARAMSGHDFFTVSPSTHHATHDGEEQEAPAMYTASEELSVSAPVQSLFTLQQHAEPEPFEVVANAPAAMEAEPALETSAPVVPGPSFVSQIEEYEPNVAPPVHVVAEAAPELEINSPIHLQPEIVVSTDPALISSDDDMSQFVTKFGKESAEEVHVGIASDLPPEQLAALTMPQFEPAEPEIMQEVPVLEPPDVVVPAMVELEIPEPVVQESSSFLVEREVPLAEPSDAKFSTNVLDEVGTMEPEAALNGSGPIVAYVPTLDDTQPIPPYVEPETPAVTEPEVVPQPVSAVVVEPVGQEPPVPQVEEPASTAHMVEAAAAAVVGGTAVASAAHFFTVAEPEPLAEVPAPVEAFVPALELQPEAPAEAMAEPIVPVAPEGPKAGPVGDAALAEELAAALDEKEAEERATAAVDAAISNAVEPAVVAAAAGVNGSEGQGIADSKLSEAISRALEKLRPHMIAEILKEMMK